jgi:nitroimidazol reductase NimA-like FMN-containing flavoprotein (pyridoxamine 5'-phosphate oxidase superfamily)
MAPGRRSGTLRSDQDRSMSATAPSTPTALVTLDREECLSLLRTAAIGRVVVLTADQTPVIRPVNFVFDERSQSVVFRCTGGTKLITLLGAARAWFEVDEIDTAGRTAWSVIIAGVTETVTQRHEVARLAGLALHSWVAGPDAHWMRIRARVVSGRRIQVSAPGADPGGRLRMPARSAMRS